MATSIVKEAESDNLSSSQIEQLPCHEFQMADSGKDKECVVCMNEYQQGEKLLVLTCFHRFHYECVLKWFADNSSCPVCRVKIEF